MASSLKKIVRDERGRFMSDTVKLKRENKYNTRQQKDITNIVVEQNYPTGHFQDDYNK